MQPPQQTQPNGLWTPIEDAKRALSLLAFVSQVLAHPVEVFLRTRFGSQYFGLAALVAFITLPMWSMFFPAESPVAIWALWAAYVVLLLRARMEATRMRVQGERIHSRYNGQSRLAGLLNSMSEARIKAVAEPIAVILTALAVMEGSAAVGSYLIVAGVALGFNHYLYDAVERAKARELNDAFIEQQQLAERFRGMQGDLFR